MLILLSGRKLRCPLVFNEEVYVNQHIKTLPPMVNSHILFGTIWKDRNGKLYNSSYLIGKNGDVNGIYNKAHLVPFGEYTPFGPLSAISSKDYCSRGAGFASGDGHDPIITSMGKVGILICYEGVFPYITNTTVAKGAQFLVNLTNDAWYERTSAAYQHLAFYVFRAVETDSVCSPCCKYRHKRYHRPKRTNQRKNADL